MGAIEPCIYPVEATKTRPAGFHVRKYVRDQWGNERQVSEIIRPVDDSDEAREEALEEARALVRSLEREKRTGKVYSRFDEPLEKDEKPRGYGIPYHEYSEGDRRAVDQELRDDAERNRRRSRQTLQEFAERTYLPWYEEHTSKSNFQKKRAAWGALKTYCETTDHRLDSRSLEAIRPSDIDGFVGWLTNRSKKDGSSYYSTSSIKGYFAVIRGLFKQWANEEGQPNPADPSRLRTDTTRLKGRKKSEKVLTPAELKALSGGIEKAIDESSDQWVHLRLILRYIHRVLMGTGLRVSEALYLRTDHLDRSAGTITVEGAAVDGEPGLTKTGKRKADRAAGTRLVPLSSAVMDTVEEWLELRTEHGYPDATDNPTIFCRRDGTYYTDDQIRSYYARASEKGKVGSKVTPHMIRHFFNDTLRKQGVPSEVREAILGHADAETNKGYTAPRAEEGLEAIEKLGSLVAG